MLPLSEITYTSPYHLYLSLKPYIETANARWSNMDLLESGLINYLNDHDDDELCLGDAVRLVKYGDNSDKNIILKRMSLIITAHMSRDEPVIARGIYPNASNGHVVLIEGIEIAHDSNGNTDFNNTYIYVNDGYGNTHQKINFKTFISYNHEGIVYFL